MTTVSSKLRVAAVVLALAALAAWAVLHGGGDSGTPVAAPPATAKAPPVKPDHGFQRLLIAHRGQPLVWVKAGHHVDLRTEPGGQLIKRVDAHTEFGDRSVFAVFQHQGRWAGVPTALLPNGHLAWLKLDARKLRGGATGYSIDVDLSAYRAELVRGKRVVRSFPVTIGAPGVETPTGRFAVTDEFRDTVDPAAYGCCALALTAHQPHLPSGWLGGNRIAIHGTSSTLGIAASHGCIRAADADVRAVQDAVPLGTPVIIHG